MKKVSVHIAAYNREAYLGAAVRSVLSAASGIDEVIVLNDGSTDGTGDVARKLAQMDDRVHVIDCEQNRGVTVARQEMLQRSAAEYVVVMDSDDWMLSGWLDAGVAWMDQHPDVAASYGRIRNVSTDGHDLNVVMGSPLSRYNLFYENPVTHPGSILRREAVLAVGGYMNPHFEQPLAMGEDLFLWSRLAAEYDLYFSGEFRLLYRQHKRQATEVCGASDLPCKKQMIEWWMYNYAAVFNHLFQGDLCDDVRANPRLACVLLGIASRMLPAASPARRILFEMADSLPVDDHGVLFHKIHYHQATGNFALADSAVNELLKAYPQDAFIQMMALKKRMGLRQGAVDDAALRDQYISQVGTYHECGWHSGLLDVCRC